MSQQECIVFCVREEPVVFLRVDNDFVPYTPRGKENLHENLHSLKRGVKVEDLELAIRKEVIWGGTRTTCLMPRGLRVIPTPSFVIYSTTSGSPWT